MANGPQVRVLNVAEKPSVAREITRHLGGAGAQRQDGYGTHYSEFPFNLRQTPCQMVVTAVRGHIMEVEFEGDYRSWQAHQPSALFTAPLRRFVDKNSKDLEQTLSREARSCQWLVLWLDCDREGEAIAFEVMEVCQRAAHGRLQVFRAVFSALTRADLIHACNNLRAPDNRLAEAVEARQEIDLRCGAAFTRWMTLRFQRMFPELHDKTLSYGPCQFPTLGFVVERWLRIQRFVPEAYWSIRMDVVKNGQSISFTWRRGRLFDRLAVLALYELCVEAAPTGATVTQVFSEPKTRHRPLPLNTVEMTKLASTKLRMAPVRCMTVAENLYQHGWISYPRTETDRFQETIDVRGMVQAHTTSSVWGAHANSLINGGRFTPPRAGPHDDHAHPPVHPVQSAERAQVGSEENWRLYELISRHFLACCSPDAHGFRTEVDVVLAEEHFSTVGLVVRDRGWLDVYPYSNWSDTPLPTFAVNEVLHPTALEMTEGRTQPPPLLSEADLIAIMDRTGIGTDATMHDHIQKIQDRQYALKNDDGRLIPSSLGVALVEGYQRFALEEGLDLSKPQLRAQMENAMTEIARGNQTRRQFLEWCIDRTQRCYTALERNAPALDAALGQHFSGRGAAPVIQAGFSTCRCGARMDLRGFRTGAIAGGGGLGPAGGGLGPAGGAGSAGTARGRGRGRGVRARAKSVPVGRAGRGARGGRGRAPRGGAATGHGRGRGRANSAPAAQGRQQRYERFLVCPNGACAIVLTMPWKVEQTLQPYAHTCPLCGFQVVLVRNESTGHQHKICPYCFNNAPQDLHPGERELRCFQCLHAGCPIAEGRRRGPGGGGGGGSGGSGGPVRGIGGAMAEAVTGTALFPCGACGHGRIMLTQQNSRWCVQCSRHPDLCQQMFVLPACITGAAVQGHCAQCGLRLRCDVGTLTLRLPPGHPALAGSDALYNVCVAGCNNDTIARLGA